MNIDLLFQILQTIFAFSSVVLILLQPPTEEASGMSNWFSPQVTRRGWDKIMFTITFIAIIGFTLSSLSRLALN